MLVDSYFFIFYFEKNLYTVYLTITNKDNNNNNTNNSRIYKRT